MKTGYTAREAASFLLRDTGLSEWHERIGKTGSIACHECADELTQMNSQHRGSVEPLVHALRGHFNTEQTA